MNELISDLNKAIKNGKSRDALEARIAADIRNAIFIDQFYTLGLDVLNEIFDKCDNIDTNSIITIVNFGYQHFGDKVLILLPHIKYGKHDNEKQFEKEVGSLLGALNFIPIVQEVKRIFHTVMMKYKDALKELESESEGVIDIDWENEFNKIKAKYEFIEKEMTITQQLFSSIEVQYRKIWGTERENIEKHIENKDLNAILEMFSKDPSLAYGDFLQMCAACGWIEGMELAINICASANNYVNEKGKKGYTALMLACNNGYLDSAKFLISKGANTNLTSKFGSTALMFACRNGHLSILKYLISQKASIYEKDIDGWTAMMLAIRYGHLEIVKYLSSFVETINVRDDDGWTPLIIASREGHLDIVKYLVSKGVDIEEKSYDGWIALMFASRHDRLDVVEYLISVGANIEAKDKDEWTSLILASEMGHLEIVKCLINKGANIEKKSKYGSTPLMIACNKGRLNVAKYLVSKGANINAKNNTGWTALMIARREKHTKILRHFNTF